MSDGTTPADVLEALHARLQAVADVVGMPTGHPDGALPPAGDGTTRPADDAFVVAPASPERVGDLLAHLVDRARSHPDASVTWLLLVALTGAFPTSEEVLDARRRLVADPPGASARWLLTTALALATVTDCLAGIDIVHDGVVVDVDFSARHDLNTGIQRVVRSTVPRWAREHELTLVAWTGTGAMRRLDDAETSRVLRWRGPIGVQPLTERPRVVVVPWRSTVVLPEVPAPHLCLPLAALAQHSGNAVSLVGYDAIPVVSADLMPPVEPERFVRYLTVVKHAHRVAAISASAAEEFRGFVDMLPAQGLTGPGVAACDLPVDVPARLPDAVTPEDGLPQVVVVGSHEPRKNHLTVLHAAEVLWREGHRFRLRFIGGSSWASRPFDRAVRTLASRGRPVEVGRAVGDDALWSAYRTARFTVFPSVHEGYGLPVAESLAVGTPAITSNFGSTREIGQDGGTLLVDPRDDDAVTDAMRQLLVDDALHARLVEEARSRRRRTWDDYARDSWAALVAGDVPSTTTTDEDTR